MFDIDLRTVALVGIMLSLFAAVVIGVQRPPLASMRLAARIWALAFLCQGVGATLALALRDVIPDGVSIIVGNAAMVAGSGLLALGVEAFVERPLRRWWLVAVTAVTAAGMALFLYPIPDVAVRIKLYNVATMACDVWMIWALAPWARDDTARSRRLTAALTATTLVILIVRTGASFGVDPSADYMALDGTVILVTAGMAGLLFATALSLQLMLSERSHGLLRKDINRRDRLISTLAHDLRTPFNTLLAGTETISRFAQEDRTDRVRDLAGRLHLAAEQAYALVDSLLVWVRNQVIGDAVALGPVPVRDAAETAVGPLLAAFERKDVRVILAVDPALGVWADTTGLQTVLRNLLANGLKYSKPGGQVTLQAERRRSQICILVQDEGVGMDAATLARVRGMEGGTSRPGTQGEAGTGLGLTFCRDLVATYRGRLEIDSTAGIGTVVRVMVPGVRKDARG